MSFMIPRQVSTAVNRRQEDIEFDASKYKPVFLDKLKELESVCED